jgi:hypothetical protein
MQESSLHLFYLHQHNIMHLLCETRHFSFFDLNMQNGVDGQSLDNKSCNQKHHCTMTGGNNWLIAQASGESIGGGHLFSDT